MKARILIGYVLLMAFSGAASTYAMRHLLYVHLEDRIDKELQRVTGEFKKYTQGTNLSPNQSIPKNNAEIFTTFVSREVVKDKYYVLLVNDQVYQTSERKLPPTFKLDAARLNSWNRIKQPASGEVELTPTSIVYYLATPIELNTGQQGIFVTLFDATGECEEISDATTIIIEVTTIVLSIALVCAWFATQKMLRPLQLLTNTASNINYHDLTERIPVQGNDEIADLTVTFNAMLDRLQVFINSQKEFFNYAGHELRTPLTVIRVNLELMSDNPDEQKKTIAIVTDELDRMSRYVNDMILLAKAEQPDFLLLENINLSELTKEIFTKAQTLGERNWQLETVGKGKIVGDRHRLTQVLMNLAQNAAQQTQVGDAIHIGSILKDGMARLWVKDTGPGIDPIAHQIIFDRFIRCPVARHRFESMGLGLAIVKTIVEAHGGHIELQSEIELGSTFTVVIPIDPPREVFKHLS